jgi:uncharacterized integral membrane protein (TIGR00697 family)
MVAMKKWTEGKYLWTRTIGSTIIGESLDTICFATIAFIGTMPNQALLTLILSMASFKILYEIFATPLTYLAVSYVKKVEGIE